MTVSDGGPHVNGGAEAIESSTLSMDDGDIYVCQDGPRDAPALLLIHGSASSTRSWDPMVPLLTGSHRVIRIDLLWHGRSAKPADRSYALPDQARRVGVALDRLGVEHAIVAGHSSGGAVATALAEQRHDLVTALALINTGPSLDAFIAPEPAAFGPSQWPPTDEQLRQFASTGFSRAGYQIPQELLDEVRAMTYHTLTTTMQATRHYMEQQALPDRLTVLGKPLLVIFGADDRRWRSSSASDYRTVPGAKVELLPGLGHSPLLEDPPRTATSLLAFTAIHAVRVD
ncbi:alpha/beta fold hydrolase [Nocardia sp. 2YAB30]|uniref:alpha/beta fold hydrolase n=1 Tax=Nocardia sp. 2YAB30 TaxID=3233022 RepID=UPI003F9491D2